MDASVVFCVVCQTYTYYTTEAFLWDFVHRHLRTRFSPALLGVWDCFNQLRITYFTVEVTCQSGVRITLRTP